LKLEAQILRLVAELHRERSLRRRVFQPGRDPVPYGGRVYDEREIQAAVKASLDFWLTLGPAGEAFESGLARFLGVKSSVQVAPMGLRAPGLRRDPALAGLPASPGRPSGWALQVRIDW
jgi:hypothetical protein